MIEMKLREVSFRSDGEAISLVNVGYCYEWKTALSDIRHLHGE